jgi:hypothetical protein
MLAKGSKLYRKNPTSSTYEEIPQCTVLTGPQIRQDFDEITNHSSPGGYKEYAATLRDGGELPLEVLWDIINIPIHVVLYDDSVAEPLPVRLWGIILPGGLPAGVSRFLTSPRQISISPRRSGWVRRSGSAARRCGLLLERQGFHKNEAVFLRTMRDRLHSTG